MGAKIEIRGNLGSDPIIANTNDGSPYMRFSVYQPHLVQDGQNGFTDKGGFWVDCVWFNHAVVEASKHLKKGSSVLILGDLRKDGWVDTDTGEERKKFKVVVKSLGMTFRPSHDEKITASTTDENVESDDEKEMPF